MFGKMVSFSIIYTDDFMLEQDITIWCFNSEVLLVIYL